LIKPAGGINGETRPTFSVLDPCLRRPPGYRWISLRIQLCTARGFDEDDRELPEFHRQRQFDEVLPLAGTEFPVADFAGVLTLRSVDRELSPRLGALAGMIW
jgi:hypothetical protein